MTEKQIRNMLSDIIKEIDYDIWKTYFVYCDGLDEDDMTPLIKIVQKHLKKATKK